VVSHAIRRRGLSRSTYWLRLTASKCSLNETGSTVTVAIFGHGTRANSKIWVSYMSALVAGHSKCTALASKSMKAAL